MALGAIYKPKAANEPKPNTEATPTPVVETPSPVSEGQGQESGTNAVPNPTDDLISKVTQFETEKSLTGKSPEEVDDVLFSDKELRAKIDSIADPALKQQYIDMRKSMMRGVNEKFQDLASIRKELEAVKNTSAYKFRANSVDELLNNQEFINEAKNKLGSERSAISDDPVLSDDTKAYIQNLESKMKQLEEGLNQKTNQEATENWNRQHETLASRYKNYDKQKIDEVAVGLATGKVKATPEYLYKVLYHDDNVKKAYELGRREGSKILENKRENITPIDGVNAVRLDSISQDKGESNLNFMQRLVAKRLAEGVKT